MSTGPRRVTRGSGNGGAPALVTTTARAQRAATPQTVPDTALQTALETALETRLAAGNPGSVVGSVCTGYGGLDLGVLAALGGGRVAWCADPDPHIAQILAARLPGVPNLGDVRAIDWTAVEPVEVLIAGFPCQDISAAGRRAGIENGARSGLWTDIGEGVRVLRPALLVVENVAALRWRHGGLHRVLGDLAEAGYDALWRSVRAADIGAAHRRERVFLLYLDTLGQQWCISHAGQCRLLLSVFPGNEEWQECQVNLSGGITWCVKDEVVALFAGRLASPFVVRVFFNLGHCFGGDGRDVRVADEQQQSGFGVAPDEVAEELVERVGDGLGSFPDLALADEDIPVVDPDEDVGLAGSVEHLTGRLALELGVKAHEEQVADLFLAEVPGGRRVPFQRVAHVAQDRKGGFVVLVCQRRLGLERPGRRRSDRSASWGDLTPPEGNRIGVSVGATLDGEPDVRVQFSISQELGAAVGHQLRNFGLHRLSVLLKVAPAPAEIPLYLVELRIEVGLDLGGVTTGGVAKYMQFVAMHICLRRVERARTGPQFEDLGITVERDDQGESSDPAGVDLVELAELLGYFGGVKQVCVCLPQRRALETGDAQQALRDVRFGLGQQFVRVSVHQALVRPATQLFEPARQISTHKEQRRFRHGLIFRHGADRTGHQHGHVARCSWRLLGVLAQVPQQAAQSFGDALMPLGLPRPSPVMCVGDELAHQTPDLTTHTAPPTRRPIRPSCRYPCDTRHTTDPVAHSRRS